jgi:hypothetical protein
MSTAQTLIDKCLFAMGASSPMKPAQPEMYQQCLDGLGSLLTKWSNLNISLGVTIPTSLTDELNNPVGTDEAIYLTLAKQMAPTFQKVLGRELLSQQKSEFSDLMTVYSPSPLPQYPSTLPVGQGNRLSGRDRAFYPASDSVVIDSNGVPILAE